MFSFKNLSINTNNINFLQKIPLDSKQLTENSKSIKISNSDKNRNLVNNNNYNDTFAIETKDGKIIVSNMNENNIETDVKDLQKKSLEINTKKGKLIVTTTIDGVNLRNVILETKDVPINRSSLSAVSSESSTKNVSAQQLKNDNTNIVDDGTKPMRVSLNIIL